MHATTADPFWHTFRTGSPIHGAALLGIALGCVAVVAMGRAARRRGPSAARRLDAAGAAIVAGIWLFLLGHSMMPVRFGWGQSVPLHVCHVVGVAAPAALWGRRRVARAVLYFWGLGITTQAILTPSVTVGPAHGQLWLYWGWHFVLVAAAAYDLGARRYRPCWRDWRLAVAVGLAYAPVAFSVDCALGTDYGWLGQRRYSQWTLMELFGPWPARVPWLVLAACATMALLAVVWPRNRKWEHLPALPGMAVAVTP